MAYPWWRHGIVAPWHENALFIIDPLWGDSSVTGGPPSLRYNNAELWCFLWWWLARSWAYSRVDGDLRRLDAHVTSLLCCHVTTCLCAQIVKTISSTSIRVFAICVCGDGFLLMRFSWCWNDPEHGCQLWVEQYLTYIGHTCSSNICQSCQQDEQIPILFGVCPYRPVLLFPFWSINFAGIKYGTHLNPPLLLEDTSLHPVYLFHNRFLMRRYWVTFSNDVSTWCGCCRIWPLWFERCVKRN